MNQSQIKTKILELLNADLTQDGKKRLKTTLLQE